MDPGTATAAGLEIFKGLWQIGGIVAVLLALLIILVGVGIMLGVRVFRHMSMRMGAVEDSRVDLLQGCIGENTAAVRHMSGKIDHQTAVIVQQTDAMRSRPCLIESGAHKTSLPGR